MAVISEHSPLKFVRICLPCWHFENWWGSSLHVCGKLHSLCDWAFEYLVMTSFHPKEYHLSLWCRKPHAYSRVRVLTLSLYGYPA
jgi:hypothetical protein